MPHFNLSKHTEEKLEGKRSLQTTQDTKQPLTALFLLLSLQLTVGNPAAIAM